MFPKKSRTILSNTTLTLKSKNTIIPYSTTPTKTSNNTFQYYPQYDIEIVPTNIPMSFKRHVKNLSDWKRILIQRIKNIDANESLM